MRLFRSKPQPPFSDAAMVDLSEMFWEDPAAAGQYPPTPGSDLLADGAWDYTIESLTQVERYLDGMRPRGPEGREAYSMVLRSGAYVGEVLRRNSKLDWHWLANEDALRVEPRLRNTTEAGVSAQWVLWDGRHGFAFPLGKVVKYFENGASDSVQAFVTGLLAQG